MRQFQFTFISGGKTKQVTVDVDIINAKCEHFTIINIEGDAATTEFKNLFPWWNGSVLYRAELNAWFKKFRGFFVGAFEYGDHRGAINMFDDSQVKTLTITPTILNKDSVNMNINVYNPDGVYLKTDIVKLKNGDDNVVDVLLGYSYNFSLSDGATWTSGSAPADIVVDGDETLAAGITASNDSEVKVLTITPTITGTGPVVMKMSGVKSGYAEDEIEVSLNTEPVRQNVLAGYTYAFSLVTEGATWTSGSSPADKAIFNDDTMSVAITI